MSIPIVIKAYERMLEVEGKPTRLETNDVWKILNVLRMDFAMEELRKYPKSSVSQSEFLQICSEISSEEEGPELARSLVKSRAVLARENIIFIRLDQDGTTFETFEGANPPDLANKVAKIAESTANAESAAPASLGMAAGPAVLEMAKEMAEKNNSSRTETLEARIKNLVSSHPVMLFMKGKPDAPFCSFSSKAVGALRAEGISFEAFDILYDEEIQQGLKAYSRWPTFPQLYYRGELIGGYEIVLEMCVTGELKSFLSE